MTLVRSAALATVAAAVVLMPTSTYADVRGHSDPAGDVRSVALDATHKIVPSPSAAEPGASFADVTRVRVDHASRKVKVVLRFRDLQRIGTGQVQEILLLTPKRSRFVFVAAGPGHWRGKVTMRTVHDKKVACSHLSRKIDYADDKITVGVPRSCLGRPSVVKVGTFTMVGTDSRVYYDDGFTNGGEFTDEFGLSPKVHR